MTNGESYELQPLETTPGFNISNGEFGFSVSLGEGYAVVGAPFITVGASGDAGAAYVYSFESGKSGGWTNQQILYVGTINAQFGWSCAVSPGANPSYIIIGGTGEYGNFSSP